MSMCVPARATVPVAECAPLVTKGRVVELVTGCSQNGPMRVFISSVIIGMEDLRSAAADAAQTLDLDVVMAEGLAAAGETPQISCLREVRASDLVILILGKRYGNPQDSGLSATHEEYREARESKPVLVFVQGVDERDPAQAAFVEEAQQWTAGTFTVPFSTPDDLRRGGYSRHQPVLGLDGRWRH